MKETQVGCITQRNGKWVLRYREQVTESGVSKTIDRGTTICDVSPDCKTEKQARERAEAKLQAVVSRRKETGLNLRLGEFVRDLARRLPENRRPVLRLFSNRIDLRMRW